MFSFSRFLSGASGRSSNDWFLFGLIGLIALLGVFAVGRSVAEQGRVATAFEGWNEDYAGYQKVLSQQAESKKPVLVYFYATWCPHCKRFTAQILSDPKMKAYVKQYPHVRIAPDNGEAEKKLMAEYGAEGFPSFYVLKQDGNRIKIDTHTRTAEGHRLKKPDEFIDSIETAAR